MSEQKSYSELIRDYIKDQHQKDSDYWNTVSIEQRNRDFSTFCDQYKNQGMDITKHQSLFTQQLAKLKKELNLKVETRPRTKKEKPATKFKVSGNQKGEITLEPKQNDSTVTNTTSTDGKKEETKVLHPGGCQCSECKVGRGEMEMLDAEMCGALPEILIDFWHIKNPRVQPLTDKQVLRVGKSLRPAFMRLFKNNETLLLYATPVLVCGQILAEKLGEAKDPNEKKKKKKSRDYSDDPDESSNVKEVEEKINEEDLPKRKMFSSSKVDKIIKDAENDDD